MTDYKEMYLKMVRETEKAIRILIAAQQACEELYLSGGSAADPDRTSEPAAEDAQKTS